MKVTCFVAMPIGDQQLPSGEIVSAHELRDRYSDLIKEAILCARPDAEVIRADEVADPGNITSDILYRLMDSDYVVADVTYPNPNVFYELGIRHACRPGTILIREATGPRVPFDISVLRYIEYHNTPTGLKKLSKGLQSRFNWFAANPGTPDNDFLAIASSRGFMFGDVQSLQDELADLHRTLDSHVSELRHLRTAEANQEAALLSYKNLIRVLATRHQRGAKFSDYVYDHLIEPSGADVTTRKFLIHAHEESRGWFYFETGATPDSDPAAFRDLEFIAVDETTGDDLIVAPFRDNPHDKGILCVFPEPLAPGTTHQVRVEYRWPGAWKRLLNELRDEAPLAVEGAPGSATSILFSIRLAPGTNLKIRRFHVAPRVGRVKIARDGQAVEWTARNPKPDTYRWEVVCERVD